MTDLAARSKERQALESPSDLVARQPPQDWYRTAREFRRDATVPTLITEAAHRSPSRPAVISDTRTITHGDFLRDVDQLARHLSSLGLAPGDLVAVLGDHTPEAVCAMVAVMKIGATYVPLDPGWPGNRIAALLAGLKVKGILVERNWLGRLSSRFGALPELREIVCMDVDSEHAWVSLIDREAVRELWDYVAGFVDPLQAAGFNLPTGQTGHTYTGPEVDAYRDHVVDLVVRDRTGTCDVLEIGCGTGLITKALAPLVDFYLATDPSPVAVDAVAEWAATHGGPTAVEVGFADEVLLRTTREFDRVVLASVTQFMPDLGYLRQVISHAVAATRHGGRIVVADVVAPRDVAQGGLHIDPAFFSELRSSDDRIEDLHVIERRQDRFAGDLATRYDVVIEVGRRESARRDPRPGQRVTTRWHISQASDGAFPARADPEGIAYVIFTSGSTGVPKGVAVRHRSVVNLIEWVNRSFALTPEDRLLMVTSFAFDLSVYDMFGILSAGGSVRLVADSERAEPEVLADVMLTEPITFWDSAPAAMSAVLPFLELGSASEGFGHLRLVFLSGDWVPLSMPDRIRSLFPAAEVVALGGATECTVWSNFYQVGKVEARWPSIPYGKPIQNSRYYVLDAERRIVPIGTVGDLYIAGEPVAAGYVGDPVLTAHKFVPDILDPEATMYRTGDLAMWLADGNLRFCGRDDHQVKVRGHRIELGEVQSVLERVPGVAESTVIAWKKSDGTELAAFFVCRRGHDLDERKVRALLGEQLPGYSVPQGIFRLAEMPLAGTGKVDRAALERWAAAPPPLTDAVMAPSPAGNPPAVDPGIASCWARVLGTPPASANADFFAVGGTSVTAAQLAVQLKRHFGRTTTLRQIIDARTPARIAGILASDDEPAAS